MAVQRTLITLRHRQRVCPDGQEKVYFALQMNSGWRVRQPEFSS